MSPVAGLLKRSCIPVHLSSAAVSNGCAVINMTQLRSEWDLKGVDVPHLALGVQLGLHTALLIQAVRVSDRSRGKRF